jgi:Leucine-rich repeat (LRR) protein
LLINIWATFHIDSQEIRDRLILLDIFTDLFCVLFPLSYTWLSLKIPTNLDEMITVVVFPTLSVLSKLNDIWEDYFKMDLQRIDAANAKHNKIRRIRSRRRNSILNLSQNRETLSTQLKYFPNWLRYGITMINIGFFIFFVSLMCVHLATQPSAETCSGRFTKEVWGGCKVTVPFCQDIFAAKCDCAVLEMKNYSQSALPESFGGLKSLLKLGVYTGALQQLPQEIGDNHARLNVLAVVGNKLRSLPDSVGNLKNLIGLEVGNNQLRSLPDSVGNLKILGILSVYNNQLRTLPDSVGNLKNLLDLYVYNNQLRSLPDSVGNLKNLLNLCVFNNQLQSLPGSVGDLKNLLNLYVYNNQLRSLPESVGNLKNLLKLWVWNNRITSLPESIGGIRPLHYVDVRHNNLTSLPASISEWDHLEYLHLAGNPLCLNLDIPSKFRDVGGLCERQCSVDCPSFLLGNERCDDNEYSYFDTKDYDPYAKPRPNSGCNTAACSYDKGDCPRD